MKQKTLCCISVVFFHKVYVTRSHNLLSCCWNVSSGSLKHHLLIQS